MSRTSKSKKARKRKRQQIGYIREVPCCRNCDAFQGALYTRDSHFQPLCRLHHIDVQPLGACDDWISKSAK